MDFFTLAVSSIPGYFLGQLYVLLVWRGPWRIAAAVPLLVMVPIVYLTWQGWQAHSNLWPILLIFVSPVAFLSLVLLAVVRLFVRWAKGLFHPDGPSVPLANFEQPS